MESKSGDCSFCNPSDSLRIAGVVQESIVDGPGIRFVVFAQGCPHHCPGCHNPVSHDFQGGYDCSLDKILTAFDRNQLLKGITFSGGEPTCQPEGFLALANAVKARGKDVWMYSGYKLEELIEQVKTGKRSPAKVCPDMAEPSSETLSREEREALLGLLNTVDVLVDGRYVESQRDLTLLYRGSANQRIIDLAQTRATSRLVLASYQEGRQGI